jgi:predicted nucleic acid-binding protein
MIEKVFVDSNVLVYAHDADSGDKQRIAVTGHAGEQSSSKIVHNALADGFRLRQSFS